jgi:hypothetical protein
VQPRVGVEPGCRVGSKTIVVVIMP